MASYSFTVYNNSNESRTHTHNTSMEIKEHDNDWIIKSVMTFIHYYNHCDDNDDDNDNHDKNNYNDNERMTTTTTTLAPYGKIYN